MRLCLQSALYSLGYSDQNFVFLSFPMHATCLTHLILLEFITITIFAEANVL